MSSFVEGQRVRIPGGLTGKVVEVKGDEAMIYLGVYDGKPVIKAIPLDRVRPTIDEELEDLL